VVEAMSTSKYTCDGGWIRYPEYNGEIKGLCINKCSCDICRTARKNDKGYQAYLKEKWAYELKIENKRTLENAIAHDNLRPKRNKDVGKMGINENAVRIFHNLKMNS
jgi:hypothetical protein